MESTLVEKINETISRLKSNIESTLTEEERKILRRTDFEVTTRTLLDKIFRREGRKQTVNQYELNQILASDRRLLRSSTIVEKPDYTQMSFNGDYDFWMTLCFGLYMPQEYASPQFTTYVERLMPHKDEFMKDFAEFAALYFAYADVSGSDLELYYHNKPVRPKEKDLVILDIGSGTSGIYALRYWKGHKQVILSDANIFVVEMLENYKKLLKTEENHEVACIDAMAIPFSGSIDHITVLNVLGKVYTKHGENGIRQAMRSLCDALRQDGTLEIGESKSNPEYNNAYIAIIEDELSKQQGMRFKKVDADKNIGFAIRKSKDDSLSFLREPDKSREIELEQFIYTLSRAF